MTRPRCELALTSGTPVISEPLHRDQENNMTHEQHLDTMAHYLSSNRPQDHLANDTCSRDDSSAAPFGNFFGDDFLALIYRSTEAHRPMLASIKTNLQVVSSRCKPRHQRAQAAVMLGRFVREHYGSSYDEPGKSSPEQWFDLARQLNSVVGAHELANTLLAEYGWKVEFDLDQDPLPRLVREPDEPYRAPPTPAYDLVDAWFLGARVTTRHLQRCFSGWTREDFHCALACIVNYLSLLPAHRGSVPGEVVAQRQTALRWLKPVWNALINVASDDQPVSSGYRAALIEQQLAIFAWLDELERDPQAVRNSLTPTAPAKPAQGEWVVVQGEIPKSSDRAENDYLKTFDVLREPMAFRPLASLEALEEVRTTLETEFPWATEAIAMVMNELIVRKRHGAVRLGITPILLAGNPGTGKTRFAQRLSELLDTPNTVINLAGMSDVKVLKGVTRGWASNRPSRMVEFIQQTRVPNPLFILDEIDKTGVASVNSGDPQDALLDLLEPGNARRYQDVFLMAECDLSHCLYIATCNSMRAIPDALLSRLNPVLFPSPGPEHAEVILDGVLRDTEKAWDLPPSTLTLGAWQTEQLRGLSPREMRRAVITLLGDDTRRHYRQH